MAHEFIARNGLISLSDTIVTGSLSVSGSVTAKQFIGTASYATTASYALNGSTGGNTFPYTGSAGISGSLILNGTYIQTGSLTISGSTTQIGNNNLLGNTTLSGSIIISGSTTSPVTPTIRVYGDMQTDGVIKFMPVSKNIDTSISASYIYVSGSTQDLYFTQNGAGYSNVTRLRWIEGNLYTGLLNGGLITTQSSTIYQVNSGSGIIVNLNASLSNNPFPTIQYLNWPNLSASIAPLSASYDQQFIGVQSNGTIFAQGTPFNDGQYDTLIPIGIVLHQNHSTINGVKTQPSLAYGWKQRSSIFTQAFGPLKLSGFTVAASGSSTGSLVVSSGTAFSDGANYAIDPNNPSYVTDNGTTTSKIFRYYQSGSDWVYNTNNGSGYPNLDPVYYNPGGLGVLDLVGTSNYSLQRVYWYPNSVTKAIVVYYGNDRYGTLALAQTALATEQFSEALNTRANAIYLGTYAIKGGTNTTLQNSNHFVWIPGGLFRGSGGSGAGGSSGGTTTPGGVTGQIQYNNGGAFDGVTNLTWDGTTLRATGSFTGSFTGSLLGTASYAPQALSSSYALSASYIQNAQTSSYVLNAISSSFATTASYILNAISSSYTLSASYAATASAATNAEQIGATFDGQGGNVSGSSFGYYRTSYPFTITNYYIDVNNSGSIQFDLRVNGTSIVVPGGNLPTLTAAPSSSANIASWTTSTIAAGTLIQYIVTGSAPTVTWAKLTLGIKRT